MNDDDKLPLDERLLDYGARIIRLVQSLPRSMITGHIARQMFRSGTSAGANYEEACAAESRADFVHKMQIVQKELCETAYWLKLLARAQVVPPHRLAALLKETHELIAIVVKSCITAKTRARR